MYTIKYNRQVIKKDLPKIKRAGLAKKMDKIIKTLADNPFEQSQSLEKLQSPVKGYCSRRLNREHRVVFHVDKVNREVLVESAWSHYE